MSLVVSSVLSVIGASSGVYGAWRAGGLDRLQTRVETARADLEAAVVRRSSVTLEIASSGLLDPAASVLLADLAHDARSAQAGRELAESDLTRALRTVFSGPNVRDSLEPGQLEPGQGADELIAELESTAHQGFIARKFYNDAVAVTAAARRPPPARVVRLPAGAPVAEVVARAAPLSRTHMGGAGP